MFGRASDGWRAGVALVASAAAVALAGCGGSGAATASSAGTSTAGTGATGSSSVTSTNAGGSTSTAASSTAASTTPAVSARHHRPAPAWRRALPDPAAGRLPPTSAQPSAATPTFSAEMRVLWDAIRADTVTPAMPAFFPLAAYEQVKAIGDAASDWQYRLVGDYRLDIAAAHALLGSDPGSAQLVSVQVPTAAVKYVPVNVCENRLGYYEVPNARIVYRHDGTTASFGIASLIAWRGVWYVIHLGAVVRHADVGIVDAPSAGAGESAPSTTC